MFAWTALFAGAGRTLGEPFRAMRALRPLVSNLSPHALVRASRVRIGKRVRLSGVPAILVGVACVVAAAGVTRVLERAIPVLPEALRETRELLRTFRGERPELKP